MDSRTCGSSQFFGRSRPPVAHGQHPGKPLVGGVSRGGNNVCYSCGQVGHFARDCRRVMYDGRRNGSFRESGGRIPKTCFICGGLGHFQSECPNAGGVCLDKRPALADSLPDDPFSNKDSGPDACQVNGRHDTFFHLHSGSGAELGPMSNGAKNTASNLVLKDNVSWNFDPWASGNRGMPRGGVSISKTDVPFSSGSQREGGGWMFGPWADAGSKEVPVSLREAAMPLAGNVQDSHGAWAFEPWNNEGGTFKEWQGHLRAPALTSSNSSQDRVGWAHDRWNDKHTKFAGDISVDAIGSLPSSFNVPLEHSQLGLLFFGMSGKVMSQEGSAGLLKFPVPHGGDSAQWAVNFWSNGEMDKDISGGLKRDPLPPEGPSLNGNAAWRVDPWNNGTRDVAKENINSFPQALWAPPGGGSLGFPIPSPLQEFLPDRSLGGTSDRGNLSQDDRKKGILGTGPDESGGKGGEEDAYGLSIDERVEQLMAGFELILGKEKEVVLEALRTASRRVNEEYELGLASEDSPRSHGGFGEYGEPWRVLSDLSGEEPGFNQEDQGVNEKIVSESIEVVQLNNELVKSESSLQLEPGMGETKGATNKAYTLQEEDNLKEIWKWPLRGGDWKLEGDPFLIALPPDKPRPETRKVVINGGRHIWDIQASIQAVDPRLAAEQDSCVRPSDLYCGSVLLLELPAFASRGEVDTASASVDTPEDKLLGTILTAVADGQGGAVDVTSKGPESNSQSQTSTSSAQTRSPSNALASGKNRLATANGMPKPLTTSSCTSKPAKASNHVKRVIEVKGNARLEGRDKPEKVAGAVNGKISLIKESVSIRKTSTGNKGSLGVLPQKVEDKMEEESLMIRKSNAVVVKQHGLDSLVHPPKQDDVTTKKMDSGGGQVGDCKKEEVQIKRPTEVIRSNGGPYAWSVDTSSDEEGGDGPWDVPLPLYKEKPASKLVVLGRDKHRFDRPENCEQWTKRLGPSDLHENGKPYHPSSPLYEVRSLVVQEFERPQMVREQFKDYPGSQSPVTPPNTTGESHLCTRTGGVPGLESAYTAALDSSGGSLKKKHKDTPVKVQESNSCLVTLKGTPPRRPIQEGTWYYQDGMGKEQGGCSLSRLQWLVTSGQLVEGSSVYRKEDGLWLPVTRLKDMPSSQQVATDTEPVISCQVANSSPQTDGALSKEVESASSLPSLTSGISTTSQPMSIVEPGCKPLPTELMIPGANPSCVQGSVDNPPTETFVDQSEIAGSSSTALIMKAPKDDDTMDYQRGVESCLLRVNVPSCQDVMQDKSTIIMEKKVKELDKCNAGEQVGLVHAGDKEVDFCKGKQVKKSDSGQDFQGTDFDGDLQVSPSLMAFIRGKLFEAAAADYKAKILQAVLVDLLKSSSGTKDHELDEQLSRRCPDVLIIEAPSEQDGGRSEKKPEKEADRNTHLETNMPMEPEKKVEELDAGKALEAFDSGCENQNVQELCKVVDHQTAVASLNVNAISAKSESPKLKSQLAEPKMEDDLSSGGGLSLDLVREVNDQNVKDQEFIRCESSSQPRKRRLVVKTGTGIPMTGSGDRDRQRRKLVVESDSEEEGPIVCASRPAIKPTEEQHLNTLLKPGKNGNYAQVLSLVLTPSNSSDNGAVSDSMESIVAEGGDEYAGHKSGNKLLTSTSGPGRLADGLKTKKSICGSQGQRPALVTPETVLKMPQECFETSVLDMVFQKLKEDAIALASIGGVCRAWRQCGLQWRERATTLDLQWLNTRCSDRTLESLVAQHYGCETLERLLLENCINITGDGLQKFLVNRPSVKTVRISNGDHLKEISVFFPKVHFLWKQPCTVSIKSDGETGNGGAARTAGYRENNQSSGEPRGSIDSKVKIKGTPPARSDGSVRGTAGASPLGSTADKGGYQAPSSRATGRPATPGGEVEQRISRVKTETGLLTRTVSGAASGAVTAGGSGGEVSMRSRHVEDMGIKSVAKAKANVAGFMTKVTGGHLKGGEIGNRLSLQSRSAVERLLEKEIGEAIKKLVEWDKNKFFTKPMSADIAPAYAQRCQQKVDIPTLQKKLRDGEYSNANGLRGGIAPPTSGLYAFDKDVQLMGRNAFLFFDEKSPIYKAAKELYKFNSKLVETIKSNILKALQAPPKVNGGVVTSKPKGKRAANSIMRKPAVKRREREKDFKGKAGKKRKEELDDESDIDSDEESEQESLDDGEDSAKCGSGKKGAKTRNVWSESEGEESEEDEADLDVYEYPEDVPDQIELASDKAQDEDEDDGEEEEAEQEEWTKKPKEYKEKMRLWGNRMTKAAMVPPMTRKYEPIEEYVIVEDKERVEKKLLMELPPNLEEKTRKVKSEGFTQGLHLDWPDVKPARKRQAVDIDVVEQEVYGIDPCTHNQLLDAMREQWHRRGPPETRPKSELPPRFSEEEEHAFIEERLLCTLNRMGGQYTGKRAPMELDLVPVVEALLAELKQDKRDEKSGAMVAFCEALLAEMRFRQENWRGFKFRAYRKGLGVVCKKPVGIKRNDFVVEFIGEIYPPWRWFEKQDGIRKIQNKESVAEFYNIYLERPRRDQGGFDVLVVDAMHKANFASRLCHSCRPNCEAKVVAVDGKYMIGVYSLRGIKCGEELTFDYASVTESVEEYNQAVCLCGDRLCKGSYLSLGGHTHAQSVMMEQHGILRRHWMLLDASSKGSLTEEDRNELKQAGLGSCLLSELPDWAVKYSFHLMRFINWERSRLPNMILQQNAKERRRKSSHANDSHEKLSQERFAKNEADGVYMARLQNLAITMDKVRYCLRKLYGESKEGPPPLRLLTGGELVHKIWAGEGSVINSLFKSMALHQDKTVLHELYRRVRAHDPGHSLKALRKSLLWLRDELMKLQPTALCRFDAAADLLHLYAYTETWFTHHEYAPFESPPMSIVPSDLGRSLGVAATANEEPWEWSKFYDRDHILGQLIHWYKQTALDPGKGLPAARRGCLVLPDPSSCFSKSLQQPIQRAYGSKQRNLMFERMINKPERGWPKASDESLWEFKNSRSLYGSPMLDSVAQNRPLNSAMMAWLRKRPINFVGPYDTQG